MFGRKKKPEAVDISGYLPELRAFAREHYVRKKKEIRYSLPPEGEKIRYSRVSYPLEETRTEEMPFRPEELKRNPAALESPAMQRYYHSWEKQKSVTNTFSSEVMRRVKEQYPKMSAFYRPAGIDKLTFNKIKNDYLYKPSRNTAVKCCLGLKLDGEKAKELMQLAGFSFSPSDPSDLVILFCIEKGIWDLMTVNALMDSFDLKDLEGNQK